ncbi:MAG: hypothetical protein COB29_00960 [Sulfitobacter sp.]|nr:MAG: hypothetical protein COB29_00960 [Sulfitobacter sp.]
MEDASSVYHGAMQEEAEKAAEKFDQIQQAIAKTLLAMDEDGVRFADQQLLHPELWHFYESNDNGQVIVPHCLDTGSGSHLGNRRNCGKIDNSVQFSVTGVNSTTSSLGTATGYKAYLSERDHKFHWEKYEAVNVMQNIQVEILSAHLMVRMGWSFTFSKEPMATSPSGHPVKIYTNHFGIYELKLLCSTEVPTARAKQTSALQQQGAQELASQ